LVGIEGSVDLVLPEGSIVNPREPAPVNSRTATIKRVTGSILAALKEVLPERIPADNAGEMLALMFGGERPDGSPYVVGELLAGGSGASHRLDGVDSVETDATNCMNLPVEAMEMDTPVRVLRYELRTDSGGAGQRRGGLGPVREYEILHGEVTFTHRGERHYASARGALGGHPGALARSTIRRANGQEETIPSKLVTTLSKGDRVTVELAGGAGHGDPRLREPDMVREDLANGKVSAESAREIYGRNEDTL
jgi:N-methylhydantoinase B/oxoprolinase/acetone carboxylase alpha subunit